MLNRREFLKLCMSSTLTLSLCHSLLPEMALALNNGQIRKPPVIWLELGSCTGDSISFDNTLDPDLKFVFQDLIDLRYHWVLLPAQGREATSAIDEVLEKHSGNFILVVEGSVMTGEKGRYDYVYQKENQLVTGLEAVKTIGEKAKHVIAIGNCACFGGPSAADPNPTKSKGVWKVLKNKVINVAGCPAHPDWFVGTLSHLILYGEPELDRWNRPTMFFGQTIHDLCQRRSDFEAGQFADYPGDGGCFFKVGCKGPVTFADCPKRQWNNHINWPVKGGSPCIGCTNPGFPDSSEPFLQHLPNIRYKNKELNPDAIGLGAGALAAGALGAHLVTSAVKGRIKKKYTEGTRPDDASPLSKVLKDEELMYKLETVSRKQDAILDQLLEKKLNYKKPVSTDYLKKETIKPKTITSSKETITRSTTTTIETSGKTKLRRRLKNSCLK